MDRLFDDFWSGRRWPLAGEGPGGLEVRTDVAETEDAIEIAAEMPGVAESDVTVELSDGVLTVRGEKRQESEEKKKDRYRCERSYGSFQRAFAVPEAVDVDAIRAEFDKGVLRLTLPKKPEAKATARRIPVGSARAQ
jgi:HSP20 family protein